MDPRPPIPPQPPSMMSRIARAIEAMASAIQQQNMTINENQRVMIYKWDVTRATTSSCVS